MTQPLGTVRNVHFDAEGHERRESLEAVACCPGCEKEIECWAETDWCGMVNECQGMCGN